MWTLSIIIREPTGQLEEYNLSADEDQSWISAITPPMDFCWATPHRCKKDPSNYKLACQTIIICSIYPEITTAFGELTDICLYVPIKRSVTTVRPRLAKLPIKSQEISQQHIGQKQKPTRLCLSGTAWRHAGWWLTYPSEKYESQLGLWHSQYDGKHKIHFSNNQPAWFRIPGNTKSYVWDWAASPRQTRTRFVSLSKIKRYQHYQIGVANLSNIHNS